MSWASPWTAALTLDAGVPSGGWNSWVEDDKYWDRSPGWAWERWGAIGCRSVLFRSRIESCAPMQCDPESLPADPDEVDKAHPVEPPRWAQAGFDRAAPIVDDHCRVQIYGFPVAFMRLQVVLKDDYALMDALVSHPASAAEGSWWNTVALPTGVDWPRALANWVAWGVVVQAILLIGTRVRRRAQLRREQRRAISCVKCGYPIVAGPARCPECGRDYGAPPAAESVCGFPHSGHRSPVSPARL